MTRGAVQILGGPTADEAAAVSAVIARLLDEEAGARATPPRVPRPPTWVLASQNRELPAAVPPSSYDTLAWAELDRIDGSSES
ncbi:MAG TPA: hypothetical protein VGC47_03320 [Acidimicrobiia bacterium]|jgi:hypothetical protein